MAFTQNAVKTVLFFAVRLCNNLHLASNLHVLQQNSECCFLNAIF